MIHRQIRFMSSAHILLAEEVFAKREIGARVCELPSQFDLLPEPRRTLPGDTAELAVKAA